MQEIYKIFFLFAVFGCDTPAGRNSFADDNLFVFLNVFGKYISNTYANYCILIFFNKCCLSVNSVVFLGQNAILHFLFSKKAICF